MVATPAEEPRQKLTIYLAKDNKADYAALIETEKTKEPVELEVTGGTATLFVKRQPKPSIPLWAKFLATTNLKGQEGVFDKSSSTAAILIVKAYGEIFLMTFGTSYHLLKNDAFERDFGLRVTLNAVDPTKLRSLDKASYDHNPLNSRTQSARDVDIFDLSIDLEMDLVYAVTGTSKIAILGSQITGRDALTINPQVSLKTLYLILKEALDQYRNPLPKEFSWIDKVARIKGIAENEALDKELDALLTTNKFENILLGEPEVVDWERQNGYSFDLRQSVSHLVLNLEDLKSYMAKKSLPFETKALKKQSIHVNDNDFKSVRNWSAYRCLYAEITVAKKQYILKNGTWYRLQEDFIQEVDRGLIGIPTYSQTLPAYAHEKEAAYNLAVSKTDTAYEVMDGRNLNFGGQHSKIEFCDLIRNKTDLIHVKYYRSSSTLSHLFAQGFVSAEVFFSGDPSFRKLLNKKLPTRSRLADHTLRPNPAKYKVVYAIATTKKTIKELPFFSRVTLKNSARRLSSIGVPVEICFIKVDPAHLVTKKIKAAKAKSGKKVVAKRIPSTKSAAPLKKRP